MFFILTIFMGFFFHFYVGFDLLYTYVHLCMN